MDIGARRFRVTKRMIVDHDDGAEGDLSGINRRLVHGSLTHDLVGYDLVFTIEEKNAKLLTRFMVQLTYYVC